VSPRAIPCQAPPCITRVRTAQRAAHAIDTSSAVRAVARRREHAFDERKALAGAGSRTTIDRREWHVTP
jgi:hypothetical protein